MEKGSLNELVLTRSVTKHIKKTNKGVKFGTGIGHDFTDLVLDEAIQEAQTRIICTEAVSSEIPIAFVKALNNFYVSGGTPQFARVVALLPESVKEGQIKEYMSVLNDQAKLYGVQLAGGHTELSACVNSPSFIITITGIANGYFHNKKAIKPGAEIIMAGYTAMLGTDIIVREKGSELAQKFAKSYIDEKRPWNSAYLVKTAAELLAHNNADNTLYMHDVSHGGVHGALWQLGVFCNKGIAVGHFSIPILQETIEFCEAFGINPYLLDGTGALLAVVKEGEGVATVKLLADNGINASVIGNVCENNDRMVFLGEAGSTNAIKKDDPSDAVFFKTSEDKFVERRCLSPIKGDEIYKVISVL